MTIRMFDCAPMAPPFPRWRTGGTTLLVETGQGLALVDTGLGLHDHCSPGRLVRFYRLGFGIPFDPESTAVRQLARLGIPPGEVKHIILTHLHFDHAGGLPDFPQAQVHVHRREYEAMRRPKTWLELAYDPADFAHQPRWVFYEQVDTNWLGLEAIRLPFQPEMYLIPLFGHTRGHCGIAIREGDGWVLQCGDALPVSAAFDLTPPLLNRLVLGPHVERLRRWAEAHPQVRLLAGHLWQSAFAAPG